MSAIPGAVQIPDQDPTFEEVIVVASMTQRDVETQYGKKPVFDVVDQAEKKFGTFNVPLATEIYALAFANGAPTNTPIRVRYKQKPSKDPSRWPPTNSLTEASAAEGGAAAPAQAPIPAAAGVTQSAAAPVAQVPQPTPPAPIPQGSKLPQQDKDEINRSVAVKVAGYYMGAMGGEIVQGDHTVDFWGFADQVLKYIVTGEDPIPSDGGAETSPDEYEWGADGE